MTSANQPLVLLHGFTGCAEVWNDVIAELPPRTLPVALDLPGHGSRSGLTASDAYSFDGVCDLISREFDRAKIDRVALWGYSMGGRIALHFSLKHPARISSLILESTSPGLPVRADRELRAKVDDELAARLVADGLERFVDGWMDQPLFASQKRLSVERQAQGRRLRLKNSAAGLEAALRGFSVGRQEPLHNRLGELAMPTLIIAGELDAKYREIGDTMAHSIPNAQLCIISHAGHAPHWERPRETASVVSEFLGRTAHI
jgi:2-succinyl-6-hydroxy-2,4-cyclohexadiene-1-carboxylate synthase